MASCSTTTGCGVSEIKVYAGRDKTIRATITTDNPTIGSPFDLTDAKIWFGVKQSESDSDEDAVIMKNNTLAGGGDDEVFVSDPETGIMYIYIIPEDTIDLDSGTYTYDVVIEDSTGKKIEAIPPSRFVIMGTVVRAEDVA